MRFTTEQYDAAIEALTLAKQQLEPDGGYCSVCEDSGHQAWECPHNPLLAVATCVGVAREADKLHTAMHGGTFNRERIHNFLHYLAGHEVRMGEQVGPKRIVMPENAVVR
jgi:hypothetical protein